MRRRAPATPGHAHPSGASIGKRGGGGDGGGGGGALGGGASGASCCGGQLMLAQTKASRAMSATCEVG